MAERMLRYGMVGGGQGAFIGGVHRMAARLDGGIELVAGALSSTPEKAVASGRELGLDDDRIYGSWEEMLERESALPADRRIDFVSIVTPNHVHFPVAKAFVEAGFHVVCDKPLVHTSEQAEELARLVEAHKVVFAVTYNYTGYPLIKQAREMVRSGQLGAIRKVTVEYHQGWLATKLEDSGLKQAGWRTDPKRAGAGGALGDIGSHAENLVSYVTGLEMASICADLTAFVEGRPIDDDTTMLVRYKGGAKGTLSASQVCVGAENALTLRVWGEKGGLAWRQEEPNEMTVYSLDGPEKVYRRGNAYIAPQIESRIPPGHPEAFIEAFATVYKNAAAAMRAGAGGLDAGEFDYPTVVDGARGVRFIEWAVASSGGDGKWFGVG
ncbi:MAG: Gfo/Idh/MocA family protein [Phycisphaerales bacterium]